MVKLHIIKVFKSPPFEAIDLYRVMPLLPIPVFGEKENKNNKKIPPPTTLQHFLFIHSLALEPRGFERVVGVLQQFTTPTTLFWFFRILL